MKTLIRTVIVLALVNLITTGPVFAGYGTVEKSPNNVDIQVQPILPAPSQVEPAKVKLVNNSGYGQSLTLPSISAGRKLAYGSLFGSASAVLVIPSAEITTEEIATITEDMNIMSRIFDKNLQQAHIQIRSMFFSSSDPFHGIFLGRGKQSTQVMYLQGYGALFMMKVDFPLSPPPQVEQEQEQTQKDEDTDKVWTEMKQEISEPEESRKNKNVRPKRVYDAEKVDNLRTTLIKSLKHAANIRNLKPDEWVILTITGSGTSTGYKSVTSIPGRNEFVVVDHNNRTQIVRSDLIGDIGLSLPTVLVIRAKKSDIDSFAKGDLDHDQFQQNTQILTSAYLADQSGLGNPFTGGYYFDYKTNPR
jgi:hypothetical protein